MGAALMVNLLPDKTWQADPLVRYRGERNKDDIDNACNVRVLNQKAPFSQRERGFLTNSACLISTWY